MWCGQGMRQWDGGGLCKPNWNELITLKPLITEAFQTWKGQHRPLRSGDTHCTCSRLQGTLCRLPSNTKTLWLCFDFISQDCKPRVMQDLVFHACMVSKFNIICKCHIFLDICLEPCSKIFYLETPWFTISYRSPISTSDTPALRRQNTSSELSQFSCSSIEGSTRNMKAIP